ncbi:acetoacetyl-CoA reductase [Streptomyces hygroscopicus]|uniref:SDR family NAD(P)-dependent oxidoreductase n=1 Tax=Streptomyces hygroscopicus TaxID=1912 RepID=UPI0022402C2A|nr:SDR family NAD(P)-dependent oxidoreductase [Streptomyces hygroscopicus]MCW7945874.1 acetoacetyl-CoA reductase [Streptomyces hygroscopicus]
MDLGLQDKRVLVTGATRGIGRATARAFADEGARVVVSYHSDESAARDVVKELGSEERAHAVQLDLEDPQSVIAGVRAAEERWGGLDVVVANAQTWLWVDPDQQPPLEDLPVDEWFGKMRANVEGHIHTVRTALRGMRERGWGRVVLLSSVTATTGMPGSEIYSAAKQALHGFARGLMWNSDGILVNVVAPGGTVTEQLANVDPAILEKSRKETPSGRLTTAEEVARLIVFLGSDGNGNINGEVIHTAGGR